MDTQEIDPAEVIKLNKKKSYLVQKKLRDTENENSGLVTYFQRGNVGDDVKQKLVNGLMMQFIDQAFFDEIRTKQQLGYVVASGASNVQNVIGAQFIIQSPSRSAEYLVNAVNQFLIDFTPVIENISDEEFEIQLNALRS